MDRWLIERINDLWASPALDPLMIGLTTIGLAALPLVALLCWRQRLGRAMLTGLAISLLATLILQWIGERPRPDDVRLVLAQPAFFAYPSGHAALAACAAMLMLLSSRRRALGWAMVALAAGIAYSRVYLGHHYPSDVFGGAVMGAAIGAACHGIMARPRRDWRWLLWPQVAIVIVITQMAYMGQLPGNLLSWPYSDKVLHFALFGAVVFWLDLWLSPRRLLRIPLSIVIPLTLAIAEELAQHFSPHRTADITDLACDLAGMLVFYLLSRRFRSRLIGQDPVEDPLPETSGDRATKPALGAERCPA